MMTISFEQLRKLEQAIDDGKSNADALAFAGLEQSDLDDAPDDDLIASFAIDVLADETREFWEDCRAWLREPMEDMFSDK